MLRSAQGHLMTGSRKLHVFVNPREARGIASRARNTANHAFFPNQYAYLSARSFDPFCRVAARCRAARALRRSTQLSQRDRAAGLNCPLTSGAIQLFLDVDKASIMPLGLCSFEGYYS